ncbi:hypothetical protein POVCU1_065570 [Plasmodium ovale curtisi]|uniref:Uncharacterized protein n=1 Tax=Plasmodium ovale curtisi TaxID=864141 RepID=A0A1A8X9H4_PLAOA|nr:hypothetical protein POVCU1_065570 [Plasmodium ovale curtisi]
MKIFVCKNVQKKGYTIFMRCKRAQVSKMGIKGGRGGNYSTENEKSGGWRFASGNWGFHGEPFPVSSFRMAGGSWTNTPRIC